MPSHSQDQSDTVLPHLAPLGPNPNQDREYWNRVAPEKNFTTPLPLELLQERLTPQARILDYGCGYGRTLTLLEQFGFTRTLGLDFALAMLQRGRREHPHLQLAACGPGRVPLPDQSMDAVLLLAVLTCIRHDRDQRSLLDELTRVLRPGGFLLVNDFLLAPDQRNQERYARFAEEFGTYGVFAISGGGVMRHHDPAWLDQLFTGWHPLIRKEATFTTMNGNNARGITLMLQRP
ncbi:Methyltransferase domain-containing protein [Paucidesulfovibrio gracilis DSM 16080]|uniref:Methyltransferase domain-containing protein n=1 Tax=Paucidesulfovibrio gracilis DSM 16080 TaxID=1121449 RepID=A0A1T4W5W6_9BACT|nr:class I SAM-dependent methyltransferase [Paucidesulfovibrio gracilis]SKA72529.1 Methyltransferase domain-containing protein [Paucidesulfovibrio gracilis DSM 16080]